MSVAVLDFPAAAPSARALMERALDPHILIGMPHLTPYGLSETWLMKELGHRHWLMLAHDMGMENADFRTSEGAEAYAAICASALRHAHLDKVAANDILTIRSSLRPVSRTQMSSVHLISCGSTAVAEVELISIFVHRLRKGDNRSIARVQLASKLSSSCRPSGLADRAAELRGSQGRLMPDCAGETLSNHIVFNVSVSQEFNGAGLFYFAEFQALMERAHEQLIEPEAGRSRIFRRDFFFFGNVQENECLTVEIIADPADTEHVSCRISRADGKVIAYAESTREERRSA